MSFLRDCAVSMSGAVQCIRVGYLARTNTAVYLYRVGSVVIDSGPPNAWTMIRSALDKSGDRPRDVFVTHHHEDHAGNAGRIAARYGARIFVHDTTFAMLTKPQNIEYYRRLVWGDPHYTSFNQASLETRTVSEDGFEVTAIAAPGHCLDHTVFRIHDHGAVFTADMYVTPRPRVARFDEDVLAGLASIERTAAAMDSHDTLFCAHRGPLHSGKRLLLEKAAWLHELRIRAEDLYLQRAMPIATVTKELLGPREDFLYYATRGDFSRVNLIRGLLEPHLRPDDAATGGHRHDERHAHWGFMSRVDDAGSIPTDRPP